MKFFSNGREKINVEQVETIDIRVVAHNSDMCVVLEVISGKEHCVFSGTEEACLTKQAELIGSFGWTPLDLS